MANNKIKKRIYYAVEIELASPINVSSGRNDFSDKDVLISTKGECFIPGTSIAGALSNVLTENEKKQLMGIPTEEEKKQLMGITTEEEKKNKKQELFRMSNLYINDLYLSQNVVSVRDGVELADDKSVNNKFDMQICETGAKGILYINYVLREQNECLENVIKILLHNIQEGYIRFGANKNRGFGRLKINKIHRQTFDCNNVSDYIDFDYTDSNNYENHYDIDEDWEKTNIKNIENGWQAGYVKINIPLRLTGGISIRKYSAKPNEADYEHITISLKDEDGNPSPVVPGSSWNGVFRRAVRELLMDIGREPEKVNNDINQWFGYVDKNKSVKAQSSIIVFGESIISNSVPLTTVRNKINRFDASTIKQALYKEKSYYTGTTNLEILIKKDPEKAYEALIGVIQIAIEDLKNGYLAVGGQTSVGKGIFEAGEDTVSYSEGNSEMYAKALLTFLEGR